MKVTKRPQDFKALPLRLTEKSVACHTVYYKEHCVRAHSGEQPAGRTLFVVNVPPYADESGLRNAFSEAGQVLSVQLCLKPNATPNNTMTFLPKQQKSSFKMAYIVFSKVAELDKALSLTELQPLESESHQIKLGMSKWMEEYNDSVLVPKVLKERVEEFMKRFDEESNKVEQKEKELEQEDEEGWVTVTKRGKVQSFARSEKVEHKIMEKEEKKKKRKELKNFYTFQIRESKMKHVVALRQKFEEDKKKIAQIKQSRRFKPF